KSVVGHAAQSGWGRGGLWWHERGNRGGRVSMPAPPEVEIDLSSFNADPYPMLAVLRREAPVAFVPQLGSTLLTRLDDIVVWEKRIEVFSSHQPQGLMN